MVWLVVGLVLFLGVHSVRIVADGWRGATIARIGEGPWKGLYSLVSAVGLALIVWGFGQARMVAPQLWVPPMGMRHLAALLTLVAFIFLAAAYVPRNGIKARLHHPMVLAVKTWALAHLLSNGSLAEVLLFGGFLLWAVFDFAAARRRDRAQATTYAPGTLAGTATAVVVGAAAWAVFVFWLHGLVTGIRPLG